VFPGAIAAIVGDPAAGAEIDLVTHAGDFVARGFFNPKSKIRVRLFSWRPDESLDRAYFAQKLMAAVRLRKAINLDQPEGACRLVNSEGDGLSGLTVDRYRAWLVVQFTALALAQRREMLADLLVEMFKPEGIYLRTERGIGQMEGLELQDGPLRGNPPPEPLVIEEDGLKFEINLAEGQKTGFYLDQRNNRRAVARLSKGRGLLDAFCYSGGFALQAAYAGASRVLGVDQSEPALELARANAQLNRLANVVFERAEVFQYLEELVERGEKFGVVVLDPPKFARTRSAIDEALRAYRRLQKRALRLLEPDGILVTCCCSGLISMDMLEGVLARVAAEEGQAVQLLERRGPALDHPVAVTCPESHYLKCLIACVR
jgi:23S rRNA (cytosine1962-C5)-methyltransferase